MELRVIAISAMRRVFTEIPYGIDHSLRVLKNAEKIMAGENPTNKERQVVELAAILHDIGAVEALRKYGSIAGNYQELEGPAMVRDILESAGASVELVERVCYIVGNHHTIEKINGLDFQILWEADLLDSLENGDSNPQGVELQHKIEANFRTLTGKELALKCCIKE